MDKIEGLNQMNNNGLQALKLDSSNDIKDFLKGFSSIHEAKMAIASVIDEIKSMAPMMANKLEQLLGALEKAEDKGISLQEFVQNLDQHMANEGAAAQNVSPVQEIQAATNDNSSILGQDGVGNTNAIV